MTSIEKHEFKMTLPTIVGVLIFVIAATAGVQTYLYKKDSDTSAKFSSLQSQIDKLTNRQGIIYTEQKNGFQAIDNRDKIRNQVYMEKFDAITKQNQETQNLLLRTKFSNGSITKN